MAPAFIRAFLLDSDAICVVPEGVFRRELSNNELATLAIDTSHSLSPVGIISKMNASYKPGIEVMTGAFRSAAKTYEAGRMALPANPRKSA